ncbi:hypothetical protein LTR86_001190 [Recurvomyces mirabilis]|nr:hypothetical protein LTR86_001190 [Recurvomyces mirabilis]
MKTIKHEPFIEEEEDNMAKDKEGESVTNGETDHEHTNGGGSEGLLTASLDELQSSDYRSILDVVDRLRLCGLGAILQLPQIVVCGNQSSGKSSVLEAITEVPFPRKENLCTRFATEIVMRRAPKDTISTKIIPDKSRPDAEVAKLEAFNQTISDFTELPQLIETATDLMGLNDAEGSGRGTKAFTRDVLSVEIAGPTRLQLTLVDLPGLIQSANKQQTPEDVKLIHELVQDYLSESRTIMLAVVSAKDDFANQSILDKCRAVDPDGQRTLGIITKPDCLRSRSSEKLWIELAQNKKIYFELGWHMLKNRSEDEMVSTFAERNSQEAAFFNSGQYRDVSAHNKGISSLRTRLAQLLYRHLKKELPNLQSELNVKHAQTEGDLQQLGEKRSTAAEQKRFLMGISTAFQGIVNSAANGHYDLPFFGMINTEKYFEDPSNMRRLRAATQHLNLQFASQIRRYGHKYRIWATDDAAGTNTKEDLPEPKLMEEYGEAKALQRTLSRRDAIEWVRDILVRSRGRELPGNFNPLLMSQLFWEQSQNWKQLAQTHIERVNMLCKDFVHAAIHDVVFADISTRLKMLKIDEALDQRCKNATDSLEQIIEDNQRPSITYDPSYTATVQEARALKTKAKMDALIRQATVKVQGGEGEKEVVNPEVLKNGLTQLIEPDMDKTSSEDALDSQLAYYKDEVKTFIANVTKQVIERELLHNLADDTLSPMIINDMSDAEVGYIAAEAEETTHKRDFLESHKAMLEAGQEAFKKALGSYK